MSPQKRFSPYLWLPQHSVQAIHIKDTGGKGEAIWNGKPQFLSLGFYNLVGGHININSLKDCQERSTGITSSFPELIEIYFLSFVLFRNIKNWLFPQVHLLWADPYSVVGFQYALSKLWLFFSHPLNSSGSVNSPILGIHSNRHSFSQTSMHTCILMFSHICIEREGEGEREREIDLSNVFTTTGKQREMRLWIKGKVIKHLLLQITARISRKWTWEKGPVGTFPYNHKDRCLSRKPSE